VTKYDHRGSEQPYRAEIEKREENNAQTRAAPDMAKRHAMPVSTMLCSLSIHNSRLLTCESNNRRGLGGTAFFGRLNICYEPSVSDTSKKRGFDFHMFTWDT
jgi:hypothetical protein